MDILIALRDSGNKKYVDRSGRMSDFLSLLSSVDGVMTFLTETWLASILQNGEVTNLVDYVFGVETGLDSNARKNRGGKLKEHLVAGVFDDAGIRYRTQVSGKAYPSVCSALGKDTKKFDFAVETASKIYLIEVNFYSVGGSKLNEVARSYTDIGTKINKLSGYEFVWVTDGQGWHAAQNNLEEAFTSIPSIYNISTLEELVRKHKYSSC